MDRWFIDLNNVGRNIEGARSIFIENEIIHVIPFDQMKRQSSRQWSNSLSNFTG